jgi:hypothetical protein
MRLSITAILTAAAAAVISTCGAGFAAEPSHDFFEAYFARAQNGKPCYGRTYDDAHLKAHGQQKVRRIEIDMDTTDSSERRNSAERFELGIAVMTRSSTEWYGQVAICKATPAAADCYLEGDGGLFKLTSASDDGLRLETGSYGISFEGTKDFLELPATSDDRVFNLKPGRSECNASDAYFKADEQ